MSTLNRRSLLGYGIAALASPSFWARQARAEGQPKRFFVVWTPNGTIQSAWGATGSADNPVYRPILAPYEKLKQHVLTFPITGRGGQHSSSCVDSLTASNKVHPPDLKEKTKHNGWANGISIDQYIANHIGKDSRLKSLELGARNDMPHPSGLIYSRISYSGPLMPLPPIDDPYAAFERVFGKGAATAGGGGTSMEQEARLAAKKSVIDFVRTQFQTLSPRLGAEQRQRLDAHLTHVREIERQLASPPPAANTCGGPLGGDRIDWRSNGNLPIIIKLQMDIAVAAMACDITRVGSLMITRGAGGVSDWPWLGVKGEHHEMSHSDEKNANNLIKVNQWYNAQVAYLIERMKATPDGLGKTLLDHSLVWYTNELAEGAHHRNGVPNVLAGHGAGFKMGRHLEHLRSQSHANFLVSLANAFGIPTTTFGNYSTGPLSGLT